MYVRQLFEIEEYKKNKIKNNCLFKKKQKTLSIHRNHKSNNFI